MATKVHHGAKLDERIRFLRAVSTPNEFNEGVPTWSTLVEVWAARDDASASESYKAAAVDAKITARFLVRSSPETRAVTPIDRIEAAGKTYNIVAAREVKRNEWLEFDAVARADV